MKPIVGILGASGRTGRLIAEELLLRNYGVRCLVRSGVSTFNLGLEADVVVGDPSNVDTMRSFCCGLNAVVCAIGARGNVPSTICSVITKNAIVAMKEERVARLIVITGAMIGHPSLGGFYRVLSRLAANGQAMEDRRLQELLVQRSGLEWTLLRPTRLRDGEASNRVLTTNDAQVKMLDSVSRRDVARMCVRALDGEWKNEAVLLRS